MASIPFTPEQREAIHAVGSGTVVSAAAGSGKTAVLAERCAYLVCDAPKDVRCHADELLVLTFTEAAAAEMRSRIVDAIRDRAQANPKDARLREQLVRIESAQISTIHAFCLWMLRRWFNEAGIDPGATILDAGEAKLLERDVLDDLLARLFAADSATGGDSVLGAWPPKPNDRDGADTSGNRQDGTVARTQDELGERFVRLVDTCGIGDDREIRALLLKLASFVGSLPHPDAWLRESVSSHPEQTVLSLFAGLRTELGWQREHVAAQHATLVAGTDAARAYAEPLQLYGEQLDAWASAMSGIKSLDALPGTSLSGEVPSEETLRAALAACERLRADITDFQFPKPKSPRLSKDTPSDILQARDAARDVFRDVRERLFQDRLHQRFSLFSVDEWLAGLALVAPQVATIADVVTAYRSNLTARRSHLDVLDFADLQRMAFGLLCDADDGESPSPIARLLHDRFVHVLVDEFQDINPIQQAIIRLASRESDPDRASNLFVVGDVKQSIYRFRLAEPGLFAGRIACARRADTQDRSIALQHNFRSRPEILEAINMLFGELMREGIGDVVYDEAARLRPGNTAENEETIPVELHVLERRWGEDGSDEDNMPDARHPARWTAIEREAYLIGSRLRAWRSASPESPLPYRDVAILLRAARVNAERMAATLSAMGIPAFADAGGSLLAAREVRDVMAALNVLDNAAQDIPLTSVLRSGIFGIRFTEDELVTMRCHAPSERFHVAVRACASDGQDVALRGKLTTLFRRVDRMRADARRRTLADTLSRLCEGRGFLAYVGGMPNGMQRRANLLKLHEVARRFGTFRRQGLFRFLRLVESLEVNEAGIAPASTLGESDDVVRIMSIHQSKGLEFPVVFLAGLGTKFNLADRSGGMIFERTTRIGLRVVDTDRMITYPTAAHSRVVAEVERTTRDEELRILYVAMTRAKERLVLIGSVSGVETYRDKIAKATAKTRPSTLSIVSAQTPLDWITSVLRGAPPGRVRMPGREPAAAPLFDVRTYGDDDMEDWAVMRDSDAEDQDLRQAVARCDPLPEGEPLAPNDPEAEDVLARLTYDYPWLASGTVPAAIAASEFKGASHLDFTRNPETRQPDEDHSGDFALDIAPATRVHPETAAHRGVATHRVMQHLDLSIAVDEAGVASELHRMVADGMISEAERQVVDQASVAWFVKTPLAEDLRAACEKYHREFQFIAAESPSYVEPGVEADPDGHVLVRGIVDGVLVRTDAVEIIDFKTDAVRSGNVAAHSERYRGQMALYARAMSRMWRRPVRRCSLVFLTGRELIIWNDPGSDDRGGVS